ncbi:hypothetical protein HA075_06880 [bacterium BFN5]|nr:hypothetical protein HA075_06825 [bacterium BFN5]QJW45594.1 hypothetical protein HA075_06880 [bacterium BFN5]
MNINSIEMVGQIADLKEVDYKNTLAVATLIELFIEKGIITRSEFSQKARELELATEAEITLMRRCKSIEK